MPAAEVPLQHQRGEGRQVTKTYQDSLRSIQEGIEYSAQIHAAETRRHNIGRVLLILIGVLPTFYLFHWGLTQGRDPADYEESLTAGITAIRDGAYPQGHELLLKALIQRPDFAEARIVSAAARYAELLEKPYLSTEQQQNHLHKVYSDIHFVVEVEPNHPKANLFLGLYYYEMGKIPEAIIAFQNSLDHVSEVPDEEDRKRYSQTASAILKRLRAVPGENLNLHSQVDDTLDDDQKQGIEVPFGR